MSGHTMYGDVVVLDEDPNRELGFVVIDDLDYEGTVTRSSKTENASESTFVCEHCNIVIHGEDQWEEHKKSKNHVKKEELKTAYDLDERDMLVDVTTLTYKAVLSSKTMFIGAESIVTDRGTEEIKCLMCRVMLKDSPTVLIHLRSAKHIHVFFKTRFPEMYRNIQRKAKNRQEIQSLVARYADEFVRKFGGKKEPRVYQKGYYQSLSEERKRQVEEIVERRHVEVMEMSMFRHRSRSPSEKSRSRRSPSPKHSRSPSRHSHSRERERYQERDRGRGRDRERIYRERSRERSLDRNRYGLPNYGSPNPRRLPADYIARRKSRSPIIERRYESPAPMVPPMRADEDLRMGVRTVQEPSVRPVPPAAVAVGQSLSSLRKEMAEVDVDKLDELPTEYEIFDTLCNAEMVELEKGERAYIQDFIDSTESPVIGVDYVAEYSDWKGQYEPGYLCTLCECRLNPAQAVKHVVNEKHTMNYMKRHYPKKFTALCIGTLGEDVRRQMKNKYVQEIATNEPKRLITQKIILPVETRQVFRRHKQIAAAKNIWTPEPQPVIEAAELVETAHPPAQEEPISRPAMLYSEKATRAKELAEIEKTLPAYCEKNLEQGWYSVRSKSIDYYEKVALAKNPNAVYFSVRDPHGKEEFYGDWNPQLMRRLQDKFNFRLEHIRWLQKLLSLADLRPLEQEVEGAVLNELIDNILKPVSTLRYMQTFEYENYDEELKREEERKKEEEEERKRRAEEEKRLREEAERKKKQAEAEQRKPVPEKQIAEVNMDADSGPEIRVRKVVEKEGSTSQGKQSVSEKSHVEERSQTPGKPESEKEKKLRMLIDSVLRVAKQQGQQHKNTILQMVVNFPNAPEILFRLATRQPAQLQQLVTVAKNPMLTIPPGILEQLHKKLKEVEAEAEEEKVLEERRRKEEAEEEERRRLEESRNRVETARMELLKSRREEEQKRQAMEIVSKKKMGSQPVQILTPKLPGKPESSAAMENMMQVAMSKAVEEVVSKLGTNTSAGSRIIPGVGYPNHPPIMTTSRLAPPNVPPYWALPQRQPSPSSGYFQ